jgi:hypothetical protein
VRYCTTAVGRSGVELEAGWHRTVPFWAGSGCTAEASADTYAAAGSWYMKLSTRAFTGRW